MRSRRAAARLALVAAGMVAATLVPACASPGMPPGGPPDDAPPALVRVTPESGAVNVRARSVLLRFDEVLSERPGGAPGRGTGSALGLGGVVIVSPGDGRERVHWRRNALEVEPRGGFRPNTAYRITVLPGLADLRGNVLEVPLEVVFSTGAEIPTGTIEGVVFDWVAGRTATGALVQAHRGTDSTLRWTAKADSLGRYVLRDLGPGAYVVRGFIDQDNDREPDEREAFDTLTVTIAGIVADTGSKDLYAFVHDTLGPRIETVQADSLSLRVRLDRPVATDWTPDSAAFVLLRADSSRVALGSWMPAMRLDSLLAVERERADSAARAADTTAARADSAAAVRPAPQVRADTSSLAPRFARPVPVREWAVRLPSPLTPGTYRLKTAGIRGMGGTSRESDREFTIRERPPADTARAP